MAGVEMEWQKYLDREQKRFIGELIEFIRIPSVSAKPDNHSDVDAAAEWVAARVRAAGFDDVKVMPTDGHPIVFGQWMLAGSDKPTVLIYGHFDVQPGEPFDQWQSEPFEPEIRDGRIYGRGASDDKGSMLTPILAVEALLKTRGMLPVNVKFFFEGQEEIGSPDLPPFVAANTDRLKADMIFSADGLQWAPDQPQIVDALKGIVKIELVVRGPESDQHSGLHGGGIANPAMALAHLLASMKSADGKITIDGFYDDVIPLPDDLRAGIALVPYDEQSYLAETGAPSTFGEPGFTTRERLWARPTLDVNGLTSGWQGAGSKTVLPAEARAKITCRIVADQTPDAVARVVRSHVEMHCPPGVTAELIAHPGNSEAFLVPADHKATEIAKSVLTEIYGRSPYLTRLGGSIPVMTTLRKTLGVHSVMFGFSHDDENLHAPNEFFRLDAYRKGQTAYVRLLQEIGERQGPAE